MRNDTEQRAAPPPSLRCSRALRWRKASERKQEEPQENGGKEGVSRKGSGWRGSKKSLRRMRAGGGRGTLRKASGWNGLNWDTLRKQASKAHLKRATRKWCRLFLNRSRFI